MTQLTPPRRDPFALQPKPELMELINSHTRILKTDGKETQGMITGIGDLLVRINSNGIIRLIPWTSIVTLTLLPTDNAKPGTAPDAPRTTDTSPAL